METVTKAQAAQETRSFNVNKLQACLCMATSAAVSIGLIILVARAFS